MQSSLPLNNSLIGNVKNQNFALELEHYSSRLVQMPTDRNTNKYQKKHKPIRKSKSTPTINPLNNQ